MDIQQEKAVLSVILNGEQAKAEIEVLEKKAEELKEAIKKAGKGTDLEKGLKKQLSDTNKDMKALQKHVVDVTKVLNNLSTSKPKELRATLSALNQQLQFGDIERGSERWNELQEKIRKVKEELKKIADESKIAGKELGASAESGLSKWEGALMVLGGNLMTAVTKKLANLVMGMKEWVNEGVSMARTAEGIERAFTELNDPDLLSGLRKATKGTVTDLELMQQAVKFEKFQLPVEELGKLLAFAQLRARETGASIDYLVESIVKGLGRESPLILDNLMINTKNLGEEAKKTGDFYGAFMKLIDQEMEQTNDLMDTSAEKAQQRAAELKNRQLEVGQVMKGVYDSVASLSNRVMLGVIDLFVRFKGVLASLAAGVITYTVATKGKVAVNMLVDFWNRKILASTIALTVREKWHAAAVTASTAVTYAKGLAHDVLAKKITLAYAAQEALRLAFMKTPWGLVMAGVAALGVGIYNLLKGTKELTLEQQSLKNITQQASAEFAEQKSKIETLVKSIENENLSNATRRAKIEELKTVMPGYMGMLDEEGKLINHNSTEIREYLKLLQKQIELKATEAERLEIAKKRNAAEMKKASAQEAYDAYVDSTKTPSRPSGTGFLDENDRIYMKKLQLKQEITDADRDITLYDDQIAKLDKLSEKRMLEIDALTAETEGIYSLIEAKKKEIEQAKEMPESTMEELTAKNKKIAALNKELSALQKLGTEETKGSGGSEDKSSKQKKKIDAALKKMEIEHLEDMSGIKRKFLDGDYRSEYEYQQAIIEQQKEYDEKRKKELNSLLETITDPSLRIDISKRIADIDEDILNRQIEQNRKLKKILLDADPVAAEKQSYENRLRELGLFGKDRADLTTEQIQALELLEKQHDDNLRKQSSQKALLDLKELETQEEKAIALLEDRRVKEKMSEQQYKDELLKIELDFLNQKLRINGLSAVKLEEINKQIVKKTADDAADRNRSRESLLDESGLRNAKDVHEQKLALIRYYEDQGIITHEEALEIKRRADLQYFESFTKNAKDSLNAVSNLSGTLSSAVSGFQQAEEMSVERKYDKLIKAAGKNSKKVAKLEEEKEKEVAGIKAKHADKQFALTVAQVISSTAVSAMEAFSAMAGIPVVGPVLGAAAAAAAIAYGASQIAVAKEQQQAAKAAYWSGGFTPPGPWDRPQGVVHSDEFVGNRFAVQNPAVRKVFNIVDEAQRNNTVSSLTEKDFTRALDYREAENRHVVSGISAAIGAGTDRENETFILESLAAWLNRNAEVTDRLNKRLDEPFETVNTVTGDMGMKQAFDKYDKMVGNKSRK
ncbi:MAG: hypothetical protein LBI65_03670 [Candidatus Symbiothrix sp.]|nr:hypothetical protein [Candidatus Symbiothrix sp.]